MSEGVLPNLVVHDPWADVEVFGGLLLTPAIQLQCLDEELFLLLRTFVSPVPSELFCRGSEFWEEDVLLSDGTSFFQDDRSFYHVGELSDVAWPLVA